MKFDAVTCDLQDFESVKGAMLLGRLDGLPVQAPARRAPLRCGEHSDQLGRLRSRRRRLRDLSPAMAETPPRLCAHRGHHEDWFVAIFRGMPEVSG